MTELPLVVINVQRGGPSTGLPTKTEQADLWQALYGRNGESPVPVIASGTPSDCFHFAFQAAKIAIEHMTPVILLTDSYLANGSEPWKIPSMKDMPEVIVPYAVKTDKEFLAYERDPKTLARKWAIPGTPGLEHRVGGLEKTIKGSVSYTPENHEFMVKTRDEKVERIVSDVPDLKVIGKKTGDLLVIGWGSSYGHIATAVAELQAEGYKVSAANFNYIRPLPKNTAKVFAGFTKLVVCELNTGQFANYLRMKHQKYSYHQYNKVQGLPFTVKEIKDYCIKLLEGKKNG
jgi:2-oxoglutarate ferredoxin oxidoreductase subunit alpha